MATLAIEVFGGIRPRLARRLGESPTASVAENVKLWHGTLAPWRQPKLVAEHDECIHSMLKVECGFIVDASPCAAFATSGSPCDRVFGTDICGFPYPVTAHLPKPCSLDIVSPDWVRLGVPQPDAVAFTVPALAPPTPAPSMEQGFQRAREHRDYVITYVNSFGEESGPSPGSVDAQDADINAPATITFPSRPPPGENWDIVSLRIYRLFTGNTDGQNLGKEGDPDYLFVEEIDLTPYAWDEPLVFIDDTPAADLLEPAPLACVNTPPECLHGIIALESGPLVAFEGKNLWFTTPWQYHDWGCHLNFDHTIKAIAEVGGMIYVATDGPPYTVSSAAPDEDCKCCRQVFLHQEPAPMVADHRAMAATPNGVVFPTNDGLVRLTGNSMSLITHSEIAEDDWQTFFPWTLKGVALNGRYLGFGQRSFTFDYSDGIYADGDVGAQSRMSTFSYQPQTAIVDKAGDVYLAFGTEIRKWDDSADFETYTWQSKLHQSHSRLNWSAARILFEDGGAMVSRSNPVTFQLRDGRQKVLHTVRVFNEEPFRLPVGIKDRAVEIRISGTTEIAAVVLATSVRELSLSAARR